MPHPCNSLKTPGPAPILLVRPRAGTRGTKPSDHKEVADMFVEIDHTVLLETLTPDSKKRLEEVKERKLAKSFEELLKEADARLDDDVTE